MLAWVAFAPWCVLLTRMRKERRLWSSRDVLSPALSLLPSSSLDRFLSPSEGDRPLSLPLTLFRLSLSAPSSLETHTRIQAPPAPAKHTAAPEVSARDQELINEFNRLHQRIEELSAATRARRADESDAADAVEEVSTAYLVADDDEEGEPPVRFVVGECFLHAASEESAAARAEAARAEAGRAAAEAAAAEAEAAGRMRELKAKLYSKFGDSINLEA